MTSARHRRNAAWLLACAGMAGLGAAAWGQCPNLRWTGEFATPQMGLATATGSGTGVALQVFDADGAGPLASELYVGGTFLSAGGVPSRGIARWDGHRWASVGGGVGPNGASVSGLGLHDPDGSGPAPAVLIVAGNFSTAGAVPASAVAAWDGQQWTAMGQTFVSLVENVPILDFDPDGAGPSPASLFIAAAGDLHRWDGTQWSFVPGSPSAIVTLEVFDEDGPGPLPPVLFAGLDGPPGLRKWDGTTWTTVDGGLRSALHTCAALRSIDEDGPGPGRPVLYVGGFFTIAGEIPTLNVARWDGQQWSALGEGLPSQVEDFAALDYTGRTGPPTIYAAQTFTSAVFRWEPGPQQWVRVGTSDASFGIFTLHRLAAFDEDGAGPGLPALYYAATSLRTVDGVPSRGLARFACACYANCDGSAAPPVLNVNDFVCFLQRFAAADLYANCDVSTMLPVLNVNDFICFQGRFAAGCP